jgi:ATP-dependent exoDNAse (exonuclease V) alpha subunit
MTTNRSKWPFTLQRRQFPLQLAFAMSIKKAQVETMKTVGIYLPKPVFTHGQLYVALSRAMCVNDVFVFCPNGKMTTNVVYTKLLQ